MTKATDFAISASLIGYPIAAIVTGAYVAKHSPFLVCNTLTSVTDCLGLGVLASGAAWPIFWIWNFTQWWLP